MPLYLGKTPIGGTGVSLTPNGTKSITKNGMHDVTEFASVDVNVAGGSGSGIEICSLAITKAQYVKVYGVHFLTCDGSTVTKGSFTQLPLSMETSYNFDNVVKNSMILIDNSAAEIITTEGDISAIAEYTGLTSGAWYSIYFIYGDAVIHIEPNI